MQSNVDQRRCVCGYACLRLDISTEQQTSANGYSCWHYRWRVLEALLYSVCTDPRLIDLAVTIFNACSSSVLNFRCYRCALLTKLRNEFCSSTILVCALCIPLRVDVVTSSAPTHAEIFSYHKNFKLSIAILPRRPCQDHIIIMELTQHVFSRNLSVHYTVHIFQN